MRPLRCLRPRHVGFAAGLPQRRVHQHHDRVRDGDLHHRDPVPRPGLRAVRLHHEDVARRARGVLPGHHAPRRVLLNRPRQRPRLAARVHPGPRRPSHEAPAAAGILHGPHDMDLSAVQARAGGPAEAAAAEGAREEEEAEAAAETGEARGGAHLLHLLS